MGDISNLDGDRLVLRGLPDGAVESATVYRGDGPGYVHHASLALFAGRLYATWSHGRMHEDDIGQRVLYSSSADGMAWSPHEPLADVTPGESHDLTLTAGGLHAASERLVACFGSWEWSEERPLRPENKAGAGEHLDVMLWATSTADGRTWTEPERMGVRCVPNHGPARTSTGRLIIAGALMHPWTDDPAGLSGWRSAGIFPRDLPFEYQDCSQGFPRAVEASGGRLPWLCEGSFFEEPAGEIHMLLRSSTGWLWEIVSRDDGLTWSEPVETRFSGESSKFHFGRLPDGRIYCVSNPDRWSDTRRCPLAVNLSSDGRDFSDGCVLREDLPPQREAGIHKGPGFQYPHSIVHGGHLYVIYSVNKEDVEVSRVPLDAL